MILINLHFLSTTEIGQLLLTILISCFENCPFIPFVRVCVCTFFFGVGCGAEWGYWLVRNIFILCYFLVGYMGYKVFPLGGLHSWLTYKWHMTQVGPIKFFPWECERNWEHREAEPGSYGCDEALEKRSSPEVPSDVLVPSLLMSALF